MRARSVSLLLLLGAAVSACGARTALRIRDASVDAPSRPDVLAVMDAAPEMDVEDVRDVASEPDVVDVSDVVDVPDVRDVVDAADACVPVEDRCGPVEICGNGLDDNCDRTVDEGCACDPGMVQRCFGGPPGRRNIGICQDGTQTCLGTRQWGPCLGGIIPRPDECNGADNLCTGCSQRQSCPILCPTGDNDPRVPTGVPFREYPLRGTDFYRGSALSWRWGVQGGPCDRIPTASPSFELRSASSSSATFIPKLSGDYTVTLTVTTIEGRTYTCSWVVHVEGPGMRIEMCYPESSVSDLDLFIHSPRNRNAWYASVGADAFEPTRDSCGWHNCEATIRGMDVGGPIPRADWGYMQSPLSECVNGPQGSQWRDLGFCANPRLDIDNNLSEGTGLPENINVDQPGNNETFRVMVHNFTGTVARPLVNVYCSGRRVATFGAAPDEVPRFEGPRPDRTIGAMWRVADVTTRIDAMGRTNCVVTPLHPPASASGYWVTFGDGQY